MIKMEDDNSEASNSYKNYSYEDEKTTKEKHEPDKPEGSKLRKIYSCLKEAREERSLGLVKSELIGLTDLSPGRVETLL